MGLDISYYSNVKCMGEMKDDDYDYNGIIVRNPECFTYQLGRLKNYNLYDSNYRNSFRAGSYGGYNQWRRELALLAGYSSVEEVWEDFQEQSYKPYNLRKLKLKSINGENIEEPKPFYELICFSDAEGVIGSEIAKKLYKDFVKYDDKAKNTNITWFYEKYQEWKEAFKVASNQGAVCFH